MSDLVARLLSEGEAALHNYILGQEEGLHLEFKTLSDTSGRSINRDDKKTLAKAICGLSNAEGGLLLLGISTKKHDNLDVASALCPIADIETLRNRIVSMLPDMLSPQHTGIAVHTMRVEGGGAGGYLAISIPPSNLRPHMSIPEHRYFRRGSDGTRMMEHGEIRDAMLAHQEGHLEFFLHTGERMSTHLMYGNTLVFGVKNIGRIPVRAPYMRFDGAPSLLNPIGPDFSIRNRSDGGLGFYAAPSFILHVDDEAIIAVFETGLQLHASDEANVAALLDQIIETRNPDLFSIRHWGDMNSNRETNVKRLFKSSIRYGAENAPLRATEVDLDLWATFDMLEPLARKAFHRSAKGL